MYPKNILLAMGTRFAENGFFYIYATFVLAYATQSLGINRQDIAYKPATWPMSVCMIGLALITIVSV
jgi:hypothetical protein